MDIVCQRSVRISLALHLKFLVALCPSTFLSWNRRWGLWDPKLQMFLQCLPNIGYPIGPQSIEEPENNEAQSPYGTKGMRIVMAIL